MKKTLFIFLSLTCGLMANQWIKEILNHPLTLNETDYEANVFDWYGHYSGLAADHTYSFSELSNWVNYSEGNFIPDYSPKSSYYDNALYTQKHIFSPGKSVFIGDFLLGKDWRKNQKHALIHNRPQDPFVVKDTVTGDLDTDQIGVNMAFCQRLFKSFIIAPFVRYDLNKSLRKKFVKARTVYRDINFGASIGYFTENNQFSLEYLYGEYQRKLEGPKDNYSPSVWIEFGEDIDWLKTASTIYYNSTTKRHSFSLADIYKIKSCLYWTLNGRYSLNETDYDLNKTNKLKYGFSQNEKQTYETSLRYLPQRKPYAFAISFSYESNPFWSRSYFYDFLYQENEFNSYSASLSFNYEFIPLIFKTFHDIKFNWFDYKHDDYMGHVFNDDNGYVLSYSLGSSYLFSETLTLLNSIEISSVNNDFFFEYESYTSTDLRIGMVKKINRYELTPMLLWRNAWKSGKDFQSVNFIISFNFF